jgi:pantoate--beta-alanine ligase
MQILETTPSVRAKVKEWRQQNLAIALVPTMGNLHQGHLSLIEKAKILADKVIVSVFINPMQFDEQADWDAYPRTLEQDIHQLTTIVCDAVFAPKIETMYPNGMDEQTLVSVPTMDDKLCGLHRPGHFDGVATVVSKLFNIVQADMAIFGEKDYQQLLLIKKLVSDMNIDIKIIGSETFREEDGLAMSSRNQNLDVQQRKTAPKLYQCLSMVVEHLQQGDKNFAELQQHAMKELEQVGFEPEYVDIRNALNLEPADESDKDLRILAAARLGQVRLIDNIDCKLA